MLVKLCSLMSLKVNFHLAFRMSSNIFVQTKRTNCHLEFVHSIQETQILQKTNRKINQVHKMAKKQDLIAKKLN